MNQLIHTTSPTLVLHQLGWGIPHAMWRNHAYAFYLDSIASSSGNTKLSLAWTYGKNESSIREVMKNKEKISFLYRLLRFRIKHQNPLHSCVREKEREYTVNVQRSVQYTLLLLYLMLVMSYCA